MQNILFIGMPGTGKGTQAKLLEKRGFEHISTGEIIRKGLDAKDPLIFHFKEKIESGGFLSDELIFELLEKHISNVSGPYILDGAVRTIDQASYVQEKKMIDRVIYFSLPTEIAVKRLLARNEDRIDDNPEAIEKRIQIYKKQTEPILDYLKIHFDFDEIDASPTILEVHKKVLDVLGI